MRSDGSIKLNIPQFVTCLYWLNIDPFSCDTQFCVIAQASPLLNIGEMDINATNPPMDSYFAVKKSPFYSKCLMKQGWLLDVQWTNFKVTGSWSRQRSINSEIFLNYFSQLWEGSQKKEPRQAVGQTSMSNWLFAIFCIIWLTLQSSVNSVKNVVPSVSLTKKITIVLMDLHGLWIPHAASIL